MKLWQKNRDSDPQVEHFTVGSDREMDLYLAKADTVGSLAHTTMLNSIGLISDNELIIIRQKLQNILQEIENGTFTMDESVEDIHSQIEFRLGEVGKKIHSGRSRNDQVLVDIKLFLRNEIRVLVGDIQNLFALLQEKSEEYKNVVMPGYTHQQVAMPSSFGLWFGAYAESLVDDCEMLLAAHKICNKNPLGSAAGYGSSFPLNRRMTTDLLGFDDLNYNVIYAQMGRGKSERVMAQAMASVASTLSRFAGDNCLYMSQNYGFVALPDEYTTGSSIMPHKKNPDVWELIRGKCNNLQALPNTISMITTNLPLGYSRDLQLLKETLFPAIGVLRSCIKMSANMLEKIVVFDTDSEKYDLMFSVESVNQLVLSGVPFREAYRKIGADIHEGNYKPTKEIHHTHEGSIGNLCNKQIADMMRKTVKNFNFDKIEKAENDLWKNLFQ